MFFSMTCLLDFGSEFGCWFFQLNPRWQGRQVYFANVLTIISIDLDPRANKKFFQIIFSDDTPVHVEKVAVHNM